MVVGKPSSFFTVLFLLLLGSSGASLELSEDEIIGLILISAAFGDDCSATGGLAVASISFNDGMVHVICYHFTTVCTYFCSINDSIKVTNYVRASVTV